MKKLLPALVVLTVSGACKKESGVPAGFGELDRAQQCNLIVDQAISAAVLFLVGLEGELAEEGQGMQAMIDCIKAHRSEPVKCLELDVEAAHELRQKREEMLAECRTWPDKVFECQARGDETSPGCAEAIARITGDLTRRPEAPRGPAVEWTFRFEDKPQHLRVSPGGTVLARLEEKLTAVREGKLLWKSDFEIRHWILVLEDGSPLVGDADGYVLNLAPDTGKVRWKVKLPDRQEKEYDLPVRARSVNAAFEGRNVIVATNEARFFRLDPRRCARNPRRCLKPAGELKDEELDYDTGFVIGEDGRRYMQETGVVRVFAPEMEQIFAFHARDSLDEMAALPGGRLAVSLDDRLAVLDVARCRSTRPIALPHKRGHESDECPDCQDPPEGCVLTDMRMPVMTWVAPTAVGSDAVVMNVEDDTRLVRAGTTIWKVSIGAVGTVAATDDQALVLSFGFAEDEPAAVRALALADGKSLWETPLPSLPKEVSYMSDAYVLAGAGWVLAGADKSIAMIRPKPTEASP